MPAIETTPAGIIADAVHSRFLFILQTNKKSSFLKSNTDKRLAESPRSSCLSSNDDGYLFGR